MRTNSIKIITFDTNMVINPEKTATSMSNKLINYRELSTILTGEPNKIRADRGTKQHKEAIKELNNLLDLWINKYKK